MTAGDIYFVAGNGQAGLPDGDGGPAVKAIVRWPESVAVDGHGNLLVADTDNYRVRVVAVRSGWFYGKAMRAGDIYTVAGNGEQNLAGGLGAGTYSGDTRLATTAQLNQPVGVATDPVGDVAITDGTNGRIRLVAGRTGTRFGRAMTAGHIYTVGGVFLPQAMTGIGPGDLAFDSAGNLLFTNSSVVQVVAIRSGTFYGQRMKAGGVYIVAGKLFGGSSGNGIPALDASMTPLAVTTDHSGNLVIADFGNQMIRVVAEHTGLFYGQQMTAGDIYTVAGGGNPDSGNGFGVPATKLYIGGVTDVTVDADGNLVFPIGSVSVFAGDIAVVPASNGTFYGQSMTGGDIYSVADPAVGGKVAGSAVTADSAGNLVIIDHTIQVLAESTGTFYDQAMTPGHLYTIAGNGIAGFAGDGGPALKAEFNVPAAVAVAHSGNVLIADEFNSRIRQITS
jgi:trimeric autotransporter adhesin